MKGITQMVLIVGVLLVLGIAVSFGFVPLGEVYQGCQVKEGLAVIPIMGYYECKEQGETYTMYEITPGWGWDPYVTIPCNEWTRSCGYYKCSDYGCTGTQEYLGSSPMGGAYETPHQIFTYYIKKTFNPYSLWIESRTGPSDWVNKEKYGCRLPIGKDYCLAGIKCDQDKLYKSGTLDFDQASNFIEQWAISPIEYAIVNHPAHGKVYCAGQGILWDVDTIQLQSGCYAYPSSQIGKADCCPGQVMGSATCVDFGWKTEDVGCGKFSVFQCTGQGTWVTDYSDINRKTVIRYTLDADGCCVPETKQTECTTNEACATGLICLLDPNTGIGHCAESGTPSTSPRTPTIISPDVSIGLFGWIKAIAVGIVASLIILGSMVIVGFFFKPLGAFLRPLYNLKMFIIITVVLGIILGLFFGGIAEFLIGMIVPGLIP